VSWQHWHVDTPSLPGRVHHDYNPHRQVDFDFGCIPPAAAAVVVVVALNFGHSILLRRVVGAVGDNVVAEVVVERVLRNLLGCMLCFDTCFSILVC